MYFEVAAPKLYLGPRLVETAEAAGVMAFSMNEEAVTRIRQLVANTHTLSGESFGPPTEVDELTIVLNWSSRHYIGSDKRFWGAESTQPYLAANSFGMVTKEAPRATRATLIHSATFERPGDGIVEVVVDSWKHPRFGSRLAEGLLDHGIYPSSRIMAAIITKCAYLDPDDNARRQTREKAQKQYPFPIYAAR